MDDTFKIYVYRLIDHHEEKIEESLDPEFLDVHEAELAFKSPVYIKGLAQVADGMLVLNFSIETRAMMPCSICNADVEVNLLITDFCHTELLSQIKNGVFDYKGALREEILLALPYRAECNGGDCPERTILAKYFTKIGD
jgi:uncharacterized metal-binding protein YceD (DUF177 family)